MGERTSLDFGVVRELVEPGDAKIGFEAGAVRVGREFLRGARARPSLASSWSCKFASFCKTSAFTVATRSISVP